MNVAVVKVSVSELRKEYFALFGLAVAFELDVNKLTPVYRELQRRFHPDRFAASTEAERVLALQQAASINDAYNVLKSPILRAQYLLELRGFDLGSEHSTLQDTQFLMQQMELREQIEEAAHSQDPEAELEALISESENNTKALCQELALIFDEKWHELEDSDASQKQSLLETAADMVKKLKFFEKLSLELEHLEETLLDF